MKKLSLLIYLLSFLFINLNAQDMDNEQLGEIINKISQEVEGKNGNWQFLIDSTYFICITDELHNRMRIISPIKEVKDVTGEEMKKCMEANFHTALDVKYALADDILWSTYIHPLRELTTEQVLSGISQIYSCVGTYGTLYSGGSLSFPSGDDRKIRQN